MALKPIFQINNFQIKMTYLIILVVSAVAQLFLPWWVIAPISFALAAWKSESAKGAFAAAAGAITTLWVAYAGYLNASTDGVMLQKIGAMFAENIKFLQKLPITGSFFTIMVLIGGNVAGFSAMAGYQLRQLFK